MYGIFFIFYLKIKVKIKSVNFNHGSYLWILQRWYDEVKDFPAANVESFSTDGAGATIGHYTQIVWGDTEYIGCGAIYYKDGNTNVSRQGTLKIWMEHNP